MKKYFTKLFGTNYECDEKGFLTKDANDEEVVLTDEQVTSEEMTEVTADAGEVEVKKLQKFIKEQSSQTTKDFLETVGVGKTMNKEMLKTFIEAIKTADVGSDSSLDKDAITKGFAQVKSSAGKSFEFDVKSLSELNSLTGEVIRSERETEIYRAPVRDPFIEELANTSTTVAPKISWTEVITETGAPATTAELATFAEKDYTFGVFEAPIYKVTVMSKHSTEILEDMPTLVAEVKKMMEVDLNLKVDEKLLLGAGTTGEFMGVYTAATTFAAGTTVVATPNKFDVLRVAMAKIADAGKGKYKPTAIILNAIDHADLDLAKGTDGHYIMPPFSTSDRTVIKGVKIVENSVMTAGTFLVGDFTKLTVRNRRGFSIQVATENGTDFEKDILTIRASRRLGSYIKGNDEGAFIKGTFSTAITDLTS